MLILVNISSQFSIFSFQFSILNFQPYLPPLLLMKCLADFVEAAGFHLEPAGGGGDHVGLVGVGGAGEGFVFEVGMLLQDFVLVAPFRQLHCVVGEVRRDEAEL